MRAEKHIHQLRRHSFKSGNVIFFCTLPDCNFKSKVAFLLGKRSICNRCGKSFIMSEYSLRLAKPHCDACHQPKVEKIIEDGLEMTATTRELTLAEKLTRTIQQAREKQQQNEEEEM